MKLLFSLILSLNPTAWVTTYVTNGYYAPAPVPQLLPGGGWYVDFPNSSSGNFLARVQVDPKKRTSISGTLSVTFRVVTTGNPQFLYNSEPFNTCVYPANIRPHFYITRQQQGVYGWWARATTYPDIFVIETNLNNTTTISVPLTPANWSNNLGKNADADPSLFNDALRAVDTIGLSIGGGCFYGHGVSVTGGTGRLEVLSYTIQ